MSVWQGHCSALSPSISPGCYLPPSECLLIWPHHRSVRAAFRLRIHPSAISVCLPLPPIPLICFAILFCSYLHPPSIPPSLCFSPTLFLSLPLFLHSPLSRTLIHSLIGSYTQPVANNKQTNNNNTNMTKMGIQQPNVIIMQNPFQSPASVSRLFLSEEEITMAPLSPSSISTDKIMYKYKYISPGFQPHRATS